MSNFAHIPDPICSPLTRLVACSSSRDFSASEPPAIACLCCEEPPRTEITVATMAFGQQIESPVERRFVDTRGWIRFAAQWAGRAAEAWVCPACFCLVTNTYGAEAFAARTKISGWYRNSPRRATRSSKRIEAARS